MHRALLDAFGGLDNERAAVAAAHAAWREASSRGGRAQATGSPPPAPRPTISAPRSTNWRRWRPKPDEEDALADRRQQMMRAEKVAGDIAEAHETVAGGASPVPILASLVRRLERKAPEAGGLLDERSRGARPGARCAGGGRTGARPGACRDQFRPARAGAHRGAPVRAARRRAQACRPRRRPAGACRTHGGRPRGARIGRGAPRGTGKGRARRALRLRRGGGRPVEAAPRRRQGAGKGGRRRASGAEARTRRVHRRDRKRPASGAAEAGIDDVAFHVRTNPGTRARAADEGRLGRRTRPLPAGPQGGARRSRLGADAGLRRDRHRRRRRRRRRHRRAPGAPGRARAGSVGHPRAAGRGAGRRPTCWSPSNRSRAARRSPPASRRSIPHGGARRLPACSPAPSSPTRRAPRPNG